MKNLKATYLILPLLAMNLSLGESAYAVATDGRASKGVGCDIEGQMKSFRLRNPGADALSGSCDFSSTEKLKVSTADRKVEEYAVTGKLKVVRKTIEVKPEVADDFDLLGRRKDTPVRRDETPQKKIVFEATLTFETDADIAVDAVRKTFVAEDVNSVNEIVSKMKGEFAQSFARMQKDIKDNAAKEKRAALVAEGEEKCLNDSEGKAYNSDQKRNCHRDRLAGLDGKDAVNYYNRNLKQQLESLVFRGDSADREEAVMILEGLSEVSAIKKSVNSLQKSVTYQNQIENLALKVQAAGNDVNAKRAAQIALVGLKQEMQQDRDMSGVVQSSALGGLIRTNRLEINPGAVDAQRYSGLLENNMKLAFLSPDKFFQTMGVGSGTGQSATDIDPANRLARGGDMSQQGFSPMPQVQAQQQILNRSGMPPQMLAQRPSYQNGQPIYQNGQSMYPNGQVMPPQQQQYMPNGYSPMQQGGLRPVFRTGAVL